MTSVASEVNALPQYSQGPRNPSGNGQSGETNFAALLDMDVQQEQPVAKKPDAPASKQAQKPEASSGQRPASKAKDTRQPDSDKSAVTDTDESQDTGSEDELQETAAASTTEEEEAEETDTVIPAELLTGETGTQETGAESEQTVAVAQPQAVALPVAAETVATPAEGEIDLMAQAAAQPQQVPGMEPDTAPVTDAPEAVLDPSLTADTGKKPEIKMPEAKVADTTGQGSGEKVADTENKLLQQHGDKNEHGQGGEGKDGNDAKAEAKPRAHNDVKPDAPQAQDTAPAAKPAADTNQLPLTPAQVHASTTGQANAASATPVAQAVPVNGIAIEIAAQARAGKNRFEIRLDPPELGRIDVRLDIDREGNVTSRLMIERADTYDLLRRDASTLERALQNAGLKTSDNALEFSLRDQGFAHRDEQSERQNRGAQVILPDGDDLGATVNPYGRALGLGNGLDIRV